MFLSQCEDDLPIAEGKYRCISGGPVDIVGTKKIVAYVHQHSKEGTSVEDLSTFVNKQVTATNKRRHKRARYV